MKLRRDALLQRHWFKHFANFSDQIWVYMSAVWPQILNLQLCNHFSFCDSVNKFTKIVIWQFQQQNINSLLERLKMVEFTSSPTLQRKWTIVCTTIALKTSSTNDHLHSDWVNTCNMNVYLLVILSYSMLANTVPTLPGIIHQNRLWKYNPTEISQVFHTPKSYWHPNKHPHY
jgi:hypothetical protein